MRFILNLVSGHLARPNETQTGIVSYSVFSFLAFNVINNVISVRVNSTGPAERTRPDNPPLLGYTSNEINTHSSSTPAVTLAVPCFDGIYLPKQENAFVHTVLDELETFLQSDNQKSVLLFPPLPSRLRYLIHRTIENQPSLSTFSVGEGWCRRVVVCYSHLRAEQDEDSDTESDASLSEDPPSRPGPAMAMASPAPSTSSLRTRVARRPDQPIYVPRGRRSQQQPSPAATAAPDPPADPAPSPPRLRSDAAEPRTPSPNQDSTPGRSAGNAPFPPELPDKQWDEPVQLGPTDPLWPPAWNQTLSYFMTLAVNDPVDKEDLVDNSVDKEDLLDNPVDKEDLVQDSQVEDSLVSKASEPPVENEDASDFNQEITAHLKEAAVSVEHAQNDYSCFENVLINQDDFPHVIEIYDFPAVFKTDDLLDAFAEYSNGGMKIKWVDNTHALGVFSCESAALHALSIRHPLLKTRTLSEGSKKAKGKALRRAEFIQPVKERPRTDSAVARRMVTRALGLDRSTARIQRY